MVGASAKARHPGDAQAPAALEATADVSTVERHAEAARVRRRAHDQPRPAGRRQCAVRRRPYRDEATDDAAARGRRSREQGGRDQRQQCDENHPSPPARVPHMGILRREVSSGYVVGQRIAAVSDNEEPLDRPG